jgi:hypothetical protein
MPPSWRAPAWLLGATALLVLTGWVVDLGIAQPQLDQLQRLRAGRGADFNQTAAQIKELREVTDLARALGGTNLEEVFAAYPSGDPAAFIGQLVDAARLARLDLAVSSPVRLGSLRRTRLSVRVLGSYTRIIGLLTALETHRRVVTVDAFALERTNATGTLEGRLNLSVYDPEVNR